MDTKGSNVLELELKYCERCGTLWLRLRDSDVVVCRSCSRALAGLSGWRTVERARGMERAGAVTVESAFWSEGGNA